MVNSNMDIMYGPLIVFDNRPPAPRANDLMPDFGGRLPI